MNVVERIQARVIVDENGCHVFQGKLERGYGRIGLGSSGTGWKNHYTHRVMYAAANGPIPSGLHIDHLCRNRACCNPDHLEAVTQAENNRRAHAANRTPTCGVIRSNQSAPNPWRAEIFVAGRSRYLGLFPTQEAAIAARQAAEVFYGWHEAEPDRRKAIEAEVASLQESS